MKVPAEVKPAAWGVAAGAVLAMLVGFWGFGWYTAGAAEELAAQRAEAAVVAAFTPVCVENATDSPAQLAQMAEESSWQRDSFIIDAGWVTPVGEEYREEVATACADDAMEAFEAQQAEADTNTAG